MSSLPRPFLLSRYFLPHFPALLRTRIAVCCSFFIQGAMFATWCSRIPDIKANLHLDEAQLGTLLFLLPAGQFLSILPNGLAVKHFGSRPSLILAGFLYPTLLVLLGFAPSALILGILLFLTGAVANLSNTAANTQGVFLEQRYGRSIMAFFHGMWSVAGLVAVGSALLFTSLRITPALHFTLLALAAATLLSFSGGALAEDPPQTTTTAQPRGLTNWRFTPTICWLGIACFGCMACEGTVYDWSSLYLKEVLHVAAQQQGIAYFAYLCTMVSGRFIIDRLVNRWGAFRILLTCSLAITLGFLITVLSPTLPTLHLAATVFGFALIGCGTSAIVPLCCSLAGSCKDLSPGIAIAEISTIGFFGFLVMPPSIGYIASAMGLRIAFAFVLLISLPVIIATLRLKRLA